MNTFIGIDPAFRKNGFAMCIIDELDKSINFKMFYSFVEFFTWVIYESPIKAFFCIENSNLQDITFQRFDSHGNKIFTSHNASRNAGKNMAVSQLTCDCLIAKYGSKNVLGISPKEKGKKIEDLRVFNAILNDNKFIVYNYNNTIPEQDKRDAYQLARIGLSRYKLRLRTSF
jgi:hypothetical protein